MDRWRRCSSRAVSSSVDDGVEWFTLSCFRGVLEGERSCLLADCWAVGSCVERGDSVSVSELSGKAGERDFAVSAVALSVLH